MGLRFVALSPYAQQIVPSAQHEGTAHVRKRAPGNRLYSSPEWLKVRQAVLVRDGFQCQLRRHCCTGTATTVDHKISRSDGGSMLPENLVAACTPCNSSKGNREKGSRQITVDW